MGSHPPLKQKTRLHGGFFNGLAEKVGLAPSGHCCYALSRFAVEPPIFINVGSHQPLKQKTRLHGGFFNGLAEKVGFEPTDPVRSQLISNQSRSASSGTSPVNWLQPPESTGSASGYNGLQFYTK